MPRLPRRVPGANHQSQRADRRLRRVDRRMREGEQGLLAYDFRTLAVTIQFCTVISLVLDKCSATFPNLPPVPPFHPTVYELLVLSLMPATCIYVR